MVGTNTTCTIFLHRSYTPNPAPLPPGISIWFGKCVLKYPPRPPDVYKSLHLLLPRSISGEVDLFSLSHSRCLKYMGHVGRARRALFRFCSLSLSRLKALCCSFAWGCTLQSTIYGAQGKFEGANLLYKRAITIYEKVYGPDHQTVATIFSCRAGLMRDQVRGNPTSIAWTEHNSKR